MSQARPSPSWHEKRQTLLFAACKAIAALRREQTQRSSAIRSIARKFRGRSLGSGHRLALSEKTMRRHWDRWNSTKPKKRSPAIFSLHYRRPGATELSPLLLKLIAEFAIQQGRTAGEVLRFVKPANADGKHLTIRTALRRLPSRQIQRLAFAHCRLTRQARALEARKAALTNKILGSPRR